MARCDYCGNECTLPFTCQHCGGKYCPDCRLPPNHSCAGIGRWNAKPVPAGGTRYSQGGGVADSGGTARKRSEEKKTAEQIPYLKIMIIIIVLALLGLAWLALSS